MSMGLFPTAAVALVAWLVIRQVIKMTKRPRLNLPYLKFEDGDNSMQRYFAHSETLLEQGYDRYLKHGLPYSMFNCMDAPTPAAILPTKYLTEVRNASSSKLSFTSLLNHFTVARDIGAPLMTDRLIRVIRQDLNKSLNDMIEPIQQVCGIMFGMLLPPSQEWTPANAHTLLLQLISMILARIFVGPELSQSREWQAVILAYSQAGHAASSRVREQYHPWLRWTAKYFDKDVKAIYAARKKGEALLQPVIDSRMADEGSKADFEGPAYNDGVKWLIQAYKAEGLPVKAEDIMQDEAAILAASVESTGMTALSILLDLVDRPDSLAEIRDEISQVYAEHGSWTRQAFGALRITDSFMKESQRLHTSQYNTMQRRALEDYTFKDGLCIPAGTSIFIPSRLTGRDPTLHANASAFDPKRWKRMREEGDVTKYHFASLQDTMLPWGSGPHACPGRFLVQEIIKSILINLVTKYDVKYPDGVDCRPPDIPNQTSSFPDLSTSLLFRNR